MVKLVPEHLQPTTDRGTPISSKRRNELIASYAPDWLIAGALWVAFALIDNVDGFHREFSLTDTSLQHTHAIHERVPVWLLFVLVGLVPLLIILLVSLGISRSFYDAHNAALGLVLCQAVTWVITDAMKITVGRPRPDIIDRCQPFAGAANAAPYGLVTSAICTRFDLLKDGFRSCPSGHSSSSFSGLGYLSFYLAGKLHLFDRRHYSGPLWIAMTPLLGAALIAVSRTMDYRHHATDVLAGGLIGIVSAYTCYSLYYPPLSDPDCHKPYAPRQTKTSLEEDTLPLHSNGDSQQYERSRHNDPDLEEQTTQRSRSNFG